MGGLVEGVGGVYVFKKLNKHAIEICCCEFCRHPGHVLQIFVSIPSQVLGKSVQCSVGVGVVVVLQQ